MTDDQMSCQTTESGTNRIGTHAPFQTNRKESETVVRSRSNNETLTTVLRESVLRAPERKEEIILISNFQVGYIAGHGKVPLI